MDKTAMCAARCRAKAEIHVRGGRVTGWHKTLPLVYAIAPFGEELWPVHEVTEVSCGVRQLVRTSYIDGCTVIWS